METWIAQTRKGLIELCVLAALKDAEAYGYQILQRLATADCLAIGESTVYPILARLAKDGMIKVRVAASPAGPSRRYYRLTHTGQSRLAEMTDYWKNVRSAIDQLLKGDKP
jgi:PadR family transcriptional regulator, regulatory protein PadR